MTYYGIFSLFPLLLLFMSLAGLALQSNEAAREQIMNVVVGLLPQGQEPLKQVIAGVIGRVGCDALFVGAHLEPVGRGAPAVRVSHAEEILRHAVIPVVIQP